MQTKKATASASSNIAFIKYWGKKDANKSYIDYRIQSLPSFLQEINVLKPA